MTGGCPYCWPLNLLWIMYGGSVPSFVLLYLRCVGGTERCVNHTLPLVWDLELLRHYKMYHCSRECWPLMEGGDFQFCRMVTKVLIVSQPFLFLEQNTWEDKEGRVPFNSYFVVWVHHIRNGLVFWWPGCREMRPLQYRFFSVSILFHVGPSL